MRSLPGPINKSGVAYLDVGQILHVQPIHDDDPKRAVAEADAKKHSYNGKTKFVEIPNCGGNFIDTSSKFPYANDLLIIYNASEGNKNLGTRIFNTSHAYPLLAALYEELYTPVEE